MKMKRFVRVVLKGRDVETYNVKEVFSMKKSGTEKKSDSKLKIIVLSALGSAVGVTISAFFL